MTDGPVLRLEIDGRPARFGATEFDRAVDQIDRGGKRATRGVERIEGSFDRLARQSSLLRTRLTALVPALGALSAGLVTREVLGYADAWRQVENQLRVAVGETANLIEVEEALFAVAKRTRQDLGAVAQLYSRLALSAGELGASQRDLLGFVEGVSQALAVNSTGAAQASGALLQLSQALGSGTVRAEEFNSILEGSQRIAKAVAAGLDRAGGSVSRLRNLVLEGEVTSRQFFDAFLSQLPAIQTEFGRTEGTVSQASTVLENSLTRLGGEFDLATGFSQGFSGALGDLASAFDELATRIHSSRTEIRDFFETADTWLDRWFSGNVIRGAVGLDPIIRGTGFEGSPELGGRRPGQDAVLGLPAPETGGGGGFGNKTLKDIRDAIADARREQERAQARAIAFLDDLRLAHFQATDDVIGAIELRRRASLSMINDVTTNEAEAAEARELINITADIEITNHLKATREEAERAKTALQEFARDGANSFDMAQTAGFRGLVSLEDALISLTLRTQTFQEAVSRMALSVAADLQRVFIRKVITAPFAGVLDDALGGLFGGGRALGGPVFPGSVYRVNERGTESTTAPGLFVPTAPGYVRNARDTAAAMGGGVTINNQLNVTMAGGSGGVGQSRQAAQEMGRELTRQMDAWWIEKMRRELRPGGALNPMGSI